MKNLLQHFPVTVVLLADIRYKFFINYKMIYLNSTI